ncbi:MAG: response regulator transcription factor [Trueperaceae bacterium]|nr:response regulator transcription factor [Trueperaceae bacterium]MCO5172590.1 response regulator transcription factor [Trueperaceae bacterium]
MREPGTTRAGLGMPVAGPDATVPVTVLVADDHELFLEGLSLLVAAMPGCEVVGTAHDGAQAVELAKRLSPRVVLMDARMPRLSGPEAIAHLVAELPGTAVVMVTMFADDELVFHAMRAGAKGYVLKGASKAELERAIMAAANGEALFDHDIVERFSRYFAAGAASGALPFDLTPREREVLALLARGLRNPALARELRVTTKTVRNHVSNVIGKLGVSTRQEAAAKAREAGLGGDKEPL